MTPEAIATALLVTGPLTVGCGRGPCDWEYVDPYFIADGGVDAAESGASGERLDLAPAECERLCGSGNTRCSKFNQVYSPNENLVQCKTKYECVERK